MAVTPPITPAADDRDWVEISMRALVFSPTPAHSSPFNHFTCAIPSSFSAASAVDRTERTAKPEVIKLDNSINHIILREATLAPGYRTQ